MKAFIATLAFIAASASAEPIPLRNPFTPRDTPNERILQIQRDLAQQQAQQQVQEQLRLQREQLRLQQEQLEIQRRQEQQMLYGK